MDKTLKRGGNLMLLANKSSLLKTRKDYEYTKCPLKLFLIMYIGFVCGIKV